MPAPRTVRRLASPALGVLVLAVLASACVPPVSPPDVPAGPPAPERLTVPIGTSTQLVMVTTTSWAASTGELTTWEQVEGTWRRVHGPVTARLGRNGFRVDRAEGDGTTPAGSFAISGLFGGQPDPGVRMPYRHLVPGDCWISDSADPAYNTWVTRSPCGAANEDLYRIGAGSYRYAAITSYNTEPVVPGKGSAIFLHRHTYAASGASVATSGCVSLAEADLLAVLRWLDPAASPRIVMGPDAWLLRPVTG